MPTLDKITVSNFRNIEFQELEFASNINCISGNNGEGKTNLLDAIYYLSMTKSAFAASDSYIYRHGTDTFSVCGTYRMQNGLLSKFAVSVGTSGEKKLRRDEKAYPRISSHIGTLPIVMVSPSDISLVSESGEERRKFANSVLAQMDSTYLNAAQQYNRLLFQRNKLLKDRNPDRGLLSVFNMKMAGHADTIYNARREFAGQMKPAVSEFYRSLSGGSETVDIEYRSDLDKGDLETVLESCTDRDLALGYTSAGVQRDDFIFTMDGHPIRRCGSQGQQKSFIVSLKFAQYEIMKHDYGFAPILLLDDVFDKLDMNRISNLLEMVSSNDFGQIFITDSNKVRLSGIVDRLTSDRAYFETSGGNFTKI
ncbi:MAG: DNA replication and repair protein RecF [Bacteroidales bacterium]|nr:DNA replication and repair protein RecF [Bacteroidales bacterium]MDE7128568.1 DNA replication and repair protein RecF [Bacteroidales bacterium]